MKTPGEFDDHIKKHLGNMIILKAPGEYYDIENTEGIWCSY